LKVQKRGLAASKKAIESELDELKSVVVSFLEHSEVYRERVRRYLRLGDDYLCVVKSSEGLSKVWAAMEEKELLPFGSYLLKLPGAVKPVERIGLFLIPFSSLPGITEGTIRSYFTRWIIPAVEEEREGFLQRQPRRIARSAEPFSYKYIAFPVRTGTIAFDTRNRKFNREFMSFIVAHQGGADYEGMKDELQEMVKGKDLLALADWSSFADLNPAQRALVEEKRREMTERLAEAGVDGIVPLSEITPERFRDVVWPALYRRVSKIKTLNIGKKVVSGAAETVRVFRKHGITV
jgi:hypothetical protein